MVFKKARRAVRYIRSKGRRANRSQSISPVNLMMAGAIYGALRPQAAKILPDMFSFGPVDSDNVLIGGAGYLGMKKGKGLIKALGAVAMASEIGIVTARATTGLNSQQNNTSEEFQY